MSIRETGLLGELRAAMYLKRQGMRIVARRYRAAHGEIDIIAQDGGTLVFVEVKNRPKGQLDAGLRAVNAEKQKRVRQSAQIYLHTHPAPDSVRFDVIEITAAGLRHIKNTF